MYKHLNQATDYSMTCIFPSSLDKYTINTSKPATLEFSQDRYLEVQDEMLHGSIVSEPSPSSVPLSPFHKTKSLSPLPLSTSVSSFIHRSASSHPSVAPSGQRSKQHNPSLEENTCSFWYGYWATCTGMGRVLDTWVWSRRGGPVFLTLDLTPA